jgi:hypothetical protein
MDKRCRKARSADDVFAGTVPGTDQITRLPESDHIVQIGWPERSNLEPVEPAGGSFLRSRHRYTLCKSIGNQGVGVLAGSSLGGRKRSGLVTSGYSTLTLPTCFCFVALERSLKLSTVSWLFPRHFTRTAMASGQTTVFPVSSGTDWSIGRMDTLVVNRTSSGHLRRKTTALSWPFGERSWDRIAVRQGSGFFEQAAEATRTQNPTIGRNERAASTRLRPGRIVRFACFRKFNSQATVPPNS